MKTFTSIAQMKLSHLTAGQQVETTGYYTPGDGGKAKYLIKAAETVDNFGNHDLAGTTVAILQNAGRINVKQFGAKGDAIADDTTAIQAAIDALDGVNSGGILYFPESEYLISSALTYQQTGTTVVNPGISFIGEGRRTSKITYSGISNFCLNIKGAANMAVASTGRFGLIDGITIKSLGFTGTGKVSGNTDGGIYVQGYNHFLLDDCLITNFGQDGLWLDRLYYTQAPDVTLDDRGAFASIIRSELSFCGRTNFQAGGLTASTDYTTDHLYTENLHVVNAAITGARIYAQNWVDNNSLFHGDTVGLHLYAQNTDILTQNVTCLGTRFEGGMSDCMLKIDSCLQGRFTNCFFPGHVGPLPLVQVKIATDVTYNIGFLTFENCIHQTATTAIDIVGTGAIVYVRLVDPRYSSITNEILNANSKPCIQIKGHVYEHVTGGSVNITLDGVAGDVLTSKLTSDPNDWLKISNSSKDIKLGPGSAAPDAAMKRLSKSATATAGMTFDVPISPNSSQAFLHAGAGTPEGILAAGPGSMYMNSAILSTEFAIYIKRTGTGNTGWEGQGTVLP